MINNLKDIQPELFEEDDWEEYRNTYQLKVGGKQYRCVCGGNVFSKNSCTCHGQYYSCTACFVDYAEGDDGM